MRKARPAFGLALGDLVLDGGSKEEWKANFFGPGAELLASVPQYLAKGNHDLGGERWLALFCTPTGGMNWQQRIGPVMLVGLDILLDWTPESREYQWLETVLSRSDAPYLFVALHAPPYTTTPHGDLDEGMPRDSLVRKAREAVLPLAERYRATAILAGHSHIYERSERPSGLTLVTTGGAGAPLSEPTGNRVEKNPYQKKFFQEHHYSLITVSDIDCRLRAVTLDGGVLDERAWLPRKGGP
ncbi:MAG: metallophosphoesterase [Planctomycetota bacterium]